MIRVSPSMGQMLDMNILLRHLLFLLEYCMVTGYDWWDVLLHVQHGMVHNLVEKLHEEYMRQNQALQQVHNIHMGTNDHHLFLLLSHTYLCLAIFVVNVTHQHNNDKKLARTVLRPQGSHF